MVPTVFESFLAANSDAPDTISQVLGWAVEGKLYVIRYPTMRCSPVVLTLRECWLVDQTLQQQWCEAYDMRPLSASVLQCDVACWCGDDDVAVTPELWNAVVKYGHESGSSSHSIVKYPGDHFFIFNTPEVDVDIAKKILLHCEQYTHI